MYDNIIKNGDIIINKQFKYPLIYIDDKYYILQDTNIVATITGQILDNSNVLKIYRSKESLNRNTIQWIYNVGKYKNYDIPLNEFDLIYSLNNI